MKNKEFGLNKEFNYLNMLEFRTLFIAYSVCLFLFVLFAQFHNMLHFWSSTSLMSKHTACSVHFCSESNHVLESILSPKWMTSLCSLCLKEPLENWNIYVEACSMLLFNTCTGPELDPCGTPAVFQQFCIHLRVWFKSSWSRTSGYITFCLLETRASSSKP